MLGQGDLRVDVPWLHRAIGLLCILDGDLGLAITAGSPFLRMVSPNILTITSETMSLLISSMIGTINSSPMWPAHAFERPALLALHAGSI